MTAPTAIFTCSICGEPSTDICVYCTKDACANHRCHRCKRCSDCCECEVPLSAAEVQAEQPAPIEEAAVEHPPDAPEATDAAPDAGPDAGPEASPDTEIEEARGEGLIL